MIRWPLAIVLAVIGSLALDPAATRAQERRDGLVAALLAEGEAAFPHTCAACHGADGGGRIGPPLRNNTASVRGLVRVLQFGRGPMPPLGAGMSDREIAAVLSYIRTSWGNDYGPVLPAEIAPHRQPTYPVQPDPQP